MSETDRRDVTRREVVDGLPVVAGAARVLEPALPARARPPARPPRSPPPASSPAPRRSPSSRAAAAACARRKRKKQGGLGEIVRARTRSWSTSTCCSRDLTAREPWRGRGRRSSCRGRGRAAVAVPARRRLGRRPACAGAARRCSGCCTSAGSRVLVGVVQPAPRPRGVRAPARRPRPRPPTAIARMRFATGVDDDLRPVPRALPRRPGDRPRGARAPAAARAPATEPWEALAGAITEQLIEFERAVAIQRRLIAALGRRCPETGLRDVPTPAAVAALAPGRARAFDLAPKRALALRRAAREVAAGRADLDAAADRPEAEAAGGGCWRSRASGRGRSRCSRCYGQGRHDLVPAGDLGYLKLVGRLTTGQPEGARRRGRGARVLRRATASGRGWRASTCASPPARGLLHVAASRRPGSSPSPGRNSLVSARAASGGRLSRPLALHPAPVGVPLRGVLPAERPAPRPRGRRPAAWPSRPPPGGRGRGPWSAFSSASTPVAGSSSQPLVAARGGLQEAAQPRGAVLVEVLAARDEDQLVVGRHAELLHPQDHRLACRGAARSTPS